MSKEEKYKKLLIETGLFFFGPSKGNFILPPRGYALWKNIQTILDKKFAQRGIQNVLLPTLLPLDLLEKEKKLLAGFSLECFYIEKIGEKKIENPLVLRPTSEVLFYDWYRQILQSYQQLPFLYNQWCSVFRAEKNTSPFFRNTEFLWQEGHTIHSSEKEARNFALSILSDYQDYAENTLCLKVIVGEKTEGEKFAGALETYTVECLLPDGQCLQLATSHYFGDNFCRLTNIKFQNKDNQIQYPFSTSWGTSTRAIGAIAKAHADDWGLILPFDIAPVQIAFILIGEKRELINYYQEVYSLLDSNYRCQLYNKNSQVNLNILQADKEGCPLKIILGPEELKKGEIILVRRDDIKRRIIFSMKDFSLFENFADKLSNFSLENENKEERVFKQESLFKIIEREKAEFQKNIYQKSADFCSNHTYSLDNFSKLKNKINEGEKGLFLIPFCNNIDCEEKIKKEIPSYSSRCIPFHSKLNLSSKCLFCQSTTSLITYLGRSY